MPIFPSSKWIALLIPLFSAVRLAKFNIDTRQTNKFIGLPTPANAIFIASLSLLLSGIQNIYFHPLSLQDAKYIQEDSLGMFQTTISAMIIANPIFLTLVTIIFSCLLIVPLPLFALKFKNFSWTDNKVRYIFLALAATLLIIFRFVGIPLIIILYIVISIINNLVSKKNSL